MNLPQIVDGNAFDELIRRAEIGRETIFDIVDEADGGKKISVTHQNLPAPLVRDVPEPAIARSLARSHVFNDIATLAAYIKREHEMETAGLETLALADVEKRVITVVLDDSDDNDRELLTYKPLTHPLFKPWEAMAGRTVDAMEFARFIMENRRAIKGNNQEARDIAMLFQQLRVSQSIKMSQGVGKRALNGVMVETVVGGARGEDFVEIPEEITIMVPIYCDTDVTFITFDLTVCGDQEGCVVTMTAADLEKKRYDAFDAMVKQLGDDANIIVGLGSVQNRAWNTVRQV